VSEESPGGAFRTCYLRCPSRKPRLAGRQAARFPPHPATPTPSIWSAISSTDGRWKSSWHCRNRTMISCRDAGKARKGAKVIYIPAITTIPAQLLRHAFRRHRRGRERVHTGVDGKALSRHSRDIFDLVVQTRAGSPISATRPMTRESRMNRFVNFSAAVRRAYWFAVAMAKQKVKNAVIISARSGCAGRRSAASWRRWRDLGHIHYAVIATTMASAT